MYQEFHIDVFGLQLSEVFLQVARLEQQQKIQRVCFFLLVGLFRWWLYVFCISDGRSRLEKTAADACIWSWLFPVRLLHQVCKKTARLWNCNCCLVVRWGEWMTISMHLLRTFEVADSCTCAAGEKADDAEALRSEAAWRMSEMAWA